jgi:hypothetical protein
VREVNLNIGKILGKLKTGEREFVLANSRAGG